MRALLVCCTALALACGGSTSTASITLTKDGTTLSAEYEAQFGLQFASAISKAFVLFENDEGAVGVQWGVPPASAYAVRGLDELRLGDVSLSAAQLKEAKVVVKEVHYTGDSTSPVEYLGVFEGKAGDYALSGEFRIVSVCTGDNRDPYFGICGETLDPEATPDLVPNRGGQGPECPKELLERYVKGTGKRDGNDLSFGGEELSCTSAEVTEGVETTLFMCGLEETVEVAGCTFHVLVESAPDTGGFVSVDGLVEGTCAAVPGGSCYAVWRL